MWTPTTSARYSSAILLEAVVDAGARAGEDRDLVAELPSGDRCLRDAHLRRHSGEEDPLDLEALEQKPERCRVEGGVAGLEDDGLAVGGRDLRDDVAAEAIHDRVPHQARRVPVPPTPVVVRVQHGDRATGSFERLDEPRLPVAE